MRLDGEVFNVLLNAFIWEVFIIISMCLVYEIALDIEKEKRRFFFVIMFVINMTGNMTKFCFMYYGAERHVKYNELIIAIIGTTVFTATILLLKLLTEADYLHILLSNMAASIIASLVCMLPYEIISSLAGRTRSTFASLDMNAAQFFLLLLTFAVITALIFAERALLKKFLSKFLSMNIKPEWFWWVVVILFNVSGLIVTSFAEKNIIFIVTDIVMASLAVFILYEASWWVRSRNEKRIRKENQALSLENAVMKEYYDTITLQMEQTRKFRHDIEKHMEVLKGILSSPAGGDGKVLEYARSLEESSGKLQNPVYCDNTVVNAILVNKKHQCDGAGIDLNIQCDSSDTIGIKEFDLAAVISNLLDNAIEGCGRLPEGTDKKISFYCAKEEDAISIKVSNTVSKDTVVSSRPGRKTSKDDDYAHGVGMSIVGDIAGKYGGNFSAKASDGVFTAVAKLNPGSGSGGG